MLITTDLLRSFAKELALSVAQIVTQATQVTLDTMALETAMESTTDRMVTQIRDKSQNLTLTRSPQLDHRASPLPHRTQE